MGSDYAPKASRPSLKSPRDDDTCGVDGIDKADAEMDKEGIKEMTQRIHEQVQPIKDAIVDERERKQMIQGLGDVRKRKAGFDVALLPAGRVICATTQYVSKASHSFQHVMDSLLAL